MAKMITHLHNSTCHYGHKCCAHVNSRGTHANASRKALKRSLKKRDRQAALKGEL